MQPDLFLKTTRCLAFPSRAGFAVNKTWLFSFGGSAMHATESQPCFVKGLLPIKV